MLPPAEFENEIPEIEFVDSQYLGRERTEFSSVPRCLAYADLCDDWPEMSPFRHPLSLSHSHKGNNVTNQPAHSLLALKRGKQDTLPCDSKQTGP